MAVKITLIICITILLFTGIIVSGIVITQTSETPYKQCLDVCAYSDKLQCAKICTQGFGEIIEDFTDKLAPIVEKLIDEKTK